MSGTTEELIARLNHGLGDMALGDIKRASRPGDQQPGGAKMAGFLLGFASSMRLLGSIQAELRRCEA
jgi:hypothetical protein